ncbi:MAG: DEAD/DEAH box helicase [Sphingobacteriaceae bacterium]
MIKKALAHLGFSALNEMQEASLKTAKENKDYVLLSPTGSGKTLGFLLPVLNLLSVEQTGVQALILVPSRELGLQIEQVFRNMSTGFKVLCCYGGHATKTEVNSLKQAPAVLIGTPGRLAYHVDHGNFDPSNVRTLVLDEFDKSLEFGFQNDMSYIIKHLTGLKKRILTSATRMPQIPDFTGVQLPLILDFLNKTEAAPDLELKLVETEAADKLDTLFALICLIGQKSTLVFCNHRDAVDRISDLLLDYGIVHGIFHGGMEQEDRERALLKFRNGTSRILVTTDLAARGLDIPEIECIIHYQLPHNREAFIHRNGRTARMHASGTSYVVHSTDEDLPDFIAKNLYKQILPERPEIPKSSEWETLYIAAGKKDKINKIDIVGLLLKKGGLVKEELGLIEVWDYAAYAAVKRNRIDRLVQQLKQEKIKGKKIKIEKAR